MNQLEIQQDLENLSELVPEPEAEPSKEEYLSEFEGKKETVVFLFLFTCFFLEVCGSQPGTTEAR